MPGWFFFISGRRRKRTREGRKTRMCYLSWFNYGCRNLQGISLCWSTIGSTCAIRIPADGAHRGKNNEQDPSVRQSNIVLVIRAIVTKTRLGWNKVIGKAHLLGLHFSVLSVDTRRIWVLLAKQIHFPARAVYPTAEHIQWCRIKTHEANRNAAGYCPARMGMDPRSLVEKAQTRF